MNNVKQGGRAYQRARYRDHVRLSVNVYDNPVYVPSGRVRGAKGTMTWDLLQLAQAARAAGRGFTYARASSRRMYVVPVVPVP